MGSATDELRERLLEQMDAKHHGAFVALTQPGLDKGQLAIHFRHEYQTYIRDFPVLLARVLGQGPPPSVRHALAENIFEEQTGKLSLGVSHPELFLEMTRGLGIEDAAILAPDLEPEAIAYRAFLDQVSAQPPWQVGAAVLTIFVEGSVHERAELAGTRSLLPIEEHLERHPLVAHYGCPKEAMRLVRAHRLVEAGHRKDAWESVLGHVGDARTRDLVATAVRRARESWLRYRDGVARAMRVDFPREPSA